MVNEKVDRNFKEEGNPKLGVFFSIGLILLIRFEFLSDQT